MRGQAGEKVVGIHVDEREDPESGKPGPPCDMAAHEFREPGNQTQRGEHGRHSHKTAEPYQCIPSGALRQYIFPLKSAEDQHDAKAEQGHDSWIESGSRSGNPQNEHHHEHTEYDPFVARHRTHFG